jgi:hypothetical protein
MGRLVINNAMTVNGAFEAPSAESKLRVAECPPELGADLGRDGLLLQRSDGPDRLRPIAPLTCGFVGRTGLEPVTLGLRVPCSAKLS